MAAEPRACHGLTMASRAANFCFDAHDPYSQTLWWAQVLGDFVLPDEDRQEMKPDDEECGLTGPDGRYLLYLSSASNLVSGGMGGADFHIYWADLRAGTLRRVTSSPAGRPANGESTSFPALSADGRTVAFGSRASNLAPGDTNGRDDIFVRQF